MGPKILIFGRFQIEISSPKMWLTLAQIWPKMGFGDNLNFGLKDLSDNAYSDGYPILIAPDDSRILEATFC